MTKEKQQKIFMRRAIELSRQKMNENCGGPFGAVIVRQGELIAEGWNKVTSSTDPTAHAEIIAIRAACIAIGDFSLKGCEIYTSCEPCPMCLAAIYWAHLDSIYYANTRKDAATIGFYDDFIYREISLPETERSKPITRILPEEAKIIFKDWIRKIDKMLY